MERSLTLPLHVITKDALCTLMERLTGRATRIRFYLLSHSMQRIIFWVICGTLETKQFGLTLLLLYEVGDVIGRKYVRVDGLVRRISSSPLYIKEITAE